MGFFDGCVRLIMTSMRYNGRYTPVEKLLGNYQMGASDDLARQYWRQREC